MIYPSPPLINSRYPPHEGKPIFKSQGKFGISEGANSISKEVI